MGKLIKIHKNQNNNYPFNTRCRKKIEMDFLKLILSKANPLKANPLKANPSIVMQNAARALWRVLSSVENSHDTVGSDAQQRDTEEEEAAAEAAEAAAEAAAAAEAEAEAAEAAAAEAEAAAAEAAAAEAEAAAAEAAEAEAAAAEAEAAVDAKIAKMATEARAAEAAAAAAAAAAAVDDDLMKQAVGWTGPGEVAFCNIDEINNFSQKEIYKLLDIVGMKYKKNESLDGLKKKLLFCKICDGNDDVLLDQNSITRTGQLRRKIRNIFETGEKAGIYEIPFDCFYYYFHTFLNGGFNKNINSGRSEIRDLIHDVGIKKNGDLCHRVKERLNAGRAPPENGGCYFEQSARGVWKMQKRDNFHTACEAFNRQ